MTARVLIACERSGVVRRAFAALGHDAWSCDIEAADDASNRQLWPRAIEAWNAIAKATGAA